MEKVFSKITVDGVSDGLNSVKDQAQLRQVVTSLYPSVQGNDLFNSKEFGGESAKYDSTRITWLDVPVGTTAEEVQKRLDEFPNARIQRTLGLKINLSASQIQARAAGINTKTDAEYAATQQVLDNNGNPVMYNGKPMYRVYTLSLQGDEDIDLREQHLAEMKEAASIASPKVVEKVEAGDNETIPV